MARKKTTFSFFRYQLLPKSSVQISLFDKDPITVEELKERKNEFFMKALKDTPPLFYDSHKDELKFKVIGFEDNLFAFKLGRKKSIILSNENLEDEEHADFPSVFIILDNNSSVQKIAISEDVEAFSNSFVVAKILSDAFTRMCTAYNLEIVVNPILNGHNFWELVHKYENSITQLKFNLVRPNMANISSTFKDDIRQLGDSTNSLSTKVELTAPKDTVLENINERNEGIAALADYGINGGTNYIHLKVKGITRTIKTEKTISKVLIDSLEMTGDPAKVVEALGKLIDE
jgi:hypothetical protein